MRSQEELEFIDGFEAGLLAGWTPPPGDGVPYNLCDGLGSTPLLGPRVSGLWRGTPPGGRRGGVGDGKGRDRGQKAS